MIARRSIAIDSVERSLHCCSAAWTLTKTPSQLEHRLGQAGLMRGRSVTISGEIGFALSRVKITRGFCIDACALEILRGTAAATSG
jgi:hypothetical protein